VLNTHFASPYRRLILIGSFTLAAILLAFIAEYGFDLHPCELCLWQRIPFYIVLGLTFIAEMARLADTPRNAKFFRLLLALAVLTLLANTALALFHTGVEQGWWEGLTACGSSNATFGDIDSARAFILGAPLINCAEPALEIFGITMASANIIFSFGLAILGLRPIFKT